MSATFQLDVSTADPSVEAEAELTDLDPLTDSLIEQVGSEDAQQVWEQKVEAEKPRMLSYLSQFAPQKEFVLFVGTAVETTNEETGEVSYSYPHFTGASYTETVKMWPELLENQKVIKADSLAFVVYKKLPREDTLIARPFLCRNLIPW